MTVIIPRIMCFFHGPCLYLWARKFHGLYGVLLQIPNNCNLIEEDHWKGSKADNKGQIDFLGVYRYICKGISAVLRYVAIESIDV